MDQNRMTFLTRSLIGMPSRRHLLRGIVGAGLGLGAARLPATAAAKHQRRKKVKRNAFGCVNAGDFCKTAAQCCSGICQGKKGKKRCRAHDTGGCPAGHTPDVCTAGAGQDVACPAGGFSGVCFTTTGKAGYCGAPATAICSDCARDAECQALYGPGAACVLCQDDCGSPACVVPGA